MEKTCCMVGCKITNDFTSRQFYQFPSDLNLCRKWAASCGDPQLLADLTHGGVESLATKTVCSWHFDSFDFIDPEFKRLKPNAVPKFSQCDLVKTESDDYTRVTYAWIKNEDLDEQDSRANRTGDYIKKEILDEDNCSTILNDPHNIDVKVDEEFYEEQKDVLNTNKAKENANRRKRETDEQRYAASKPKNGTLCIMDQQRKEPISASHPKKRSKKHLSVDEKNAIINMHKAYQLEHPDLAQTDSVNFTSNASGVSVSSVYKVLAEYKANHEVKPPKIYHRSRAILDSISEETKMGVRRTIHRFFLRNEMPTCDKIVTEVNNDENLPNFKKSTLLKLLNELNFRFKRGQKNSILKEKDKVIITRRRYLRAIKHAREEGRKIYYLDETWVNAFIEGLSTELKNPSGKDSRLVVLHIGCEDGFVENGLLVFESKKTGDYHSDMNSEIFEEWFLNILPHLEENAVIVLDNASYHSRRLNKAPTIETRKEEIKEWLRKANVAYDEEMVKAELLSLVKKNKSVDKYAVDEMALSLNRTVLRLPPYHCEFNPIALIWAQIKDEVARKNNTFKMNGLKNLFREAVGNVTPQNWKNALEHVQKEEEKMWEADTLMEIIVEPFLINLGSDYDTSDSD